MLAMGPAIFAARTAPWERRTFPDWDSATTDKVLTDSPWARPLTVGFEYSAPPLGGRLQSDFLQIGLPGGLGLPSPFPGPRNRPAPGSEPIPQTGSTSVRTEAYLIVRWASALPVRQAMALEQFGRQGLGRPEVREMLETPPKDYVLEIAGFPAIAFPKGPDWLAEQLQHSAHVAVKGRRALSATACRVPPQGMHLAAEIRFPREEPFQLEDGQIEVTAAVAGMAIAARFKLRPMIYQERLEL